MTLSINDTQHNWTLSISMQVYYAECHYAECCYAECRYAECGYAECRAVVVTTSYFLLTLQMSLVSWSICTSHAFPA
jgi:hypothetical protein